MTRRPQVLIVQEGLRQYRVPLFDGLRSRLAGEGIDLMLVHGEPNPAVAARHDAGSLQWATEVRNRRLSVGGRTVLWQPVLGAARGVDLVVVEQASRMLVNYLLLAGQRSVGPAVALWGHGGSTRASSSMTGTVTRAVRSLMSRTPRWWFPYTEAGADYVRRLGFPDNQITVLWNAVDTSWATQGAVARIPDRCVFIGSLYPAKCLEFLVDATDIIAQRRPTFTLVVVGDGPQRDQVEAWASTRSYMRYVGPRFGTSKGAELRAAQLVLNPGLVGLTVLDALAAGTPMVTTDTPLHSPEIDYLSRDRNGWVTSHCVQDFAYKVDGLLARPHAIEAARAACRSTAQFYSLDNMISHFTIGIRAALETKPPATRTIVRRAWRTQ